MGSELEREAYHPAFHLSLVLPPNRVLKNEVDSRLSGVGREVDGFKGIDWVLEVGVGWWKW